MGSMREADDRKRLAERVRMACVEAALEGYEDAAQSGLCHEGAFEAAVSAIRKLDVGALAEKPRVARKRSR
jgi:hypothetical protein